MKVQKRIQNDIAFVIPYGMLIGGDEIETLDKILVKYENNGIKLCVIDFTNIRLINSSGAGFLVKKKNNFRNSGKDLRIININKTVKKFLDITRLSEYLH